MEKAHYRIDVGTRQEHAPNRRWSRIVRGWRELRGSEHLMSQIRRSTEKKPGLGVRREGNLRLCARAAFQRAAAQRATVRTVAIPLGKAAPGCGAEDLYAHSGTAASDSFWRRGGLKFGVGVRANFAIEVDLFVLGGGPFHEKGLL
jgi:hypothetical protein